AAGAARLLRRCHRRPCQRQGARARCRAHRLFLRTGQCRDCRCVRALLARQAHDHLATLCAIARHCCDSLMLWFDLPPAGHAIAWRGKDHPLPQFPGYRSLWVNSGTAALAAAMWLARQRQPSIAQPEVILPAYGCPDLVAAAVHAGVRPVLVDIGSEDPGYDLDALAAALSARTVAVVAVNFLGIAERLQQLRECIAAFPQIALIEDDAQWFPEPLPAPPLEGDYICISFGRGKPVSLLGGGLLLVKDSLPTDWPIQPAADAGAALLPKLLAYNALLRPAAYGLISRNPFLKLGQTVYKPL